MNDKELLELAAKAAEIELDGWSKASQKFYEVNGLLWNPLTDDGDALRLAGSIGLTVDIGLNLYTEVDGQYNRDPMQPIDTVQEPFNGDSESATRRAIVRAAAEIGKQGSKP